MTWRVQREDVEVFRRELWKDERSFREKIPTSKSEFLKYCFDGRRADLELAAIAVLRDAPGEPLCPAARRAGNASLILDRVYGIRLFDLIRLLRQLEIANRDGKAARAIHVLMQRERKRLERIQRIFLRSMSSLAVCAYPMQNKLESLLYLLSHIFGAQASLESAREELSRYSIYWNEHCSLLPFRDATTKNTIVGIPALAPSVHEDEIDRLQALGDLVKNAGELWESIPLWDVDFSSVEHLTTPEDDPISLHCHEWTDGTCSYTPGHFLLLSDKFASDGYRAAATLFIRYLRFGGRKLAYKIINSQGFEVRFRYDDPLFYFETLEDKCNLLSPRFVADFPAFFRLIRDIGYHVSNPSPADEALLRVDHFRRVFDRADYWQENPDERTEKA